MRKQLLGSGCSLVAMAVLSGLAACSSSSGHPTPTDGGHSDAKTSPTDGGNGCKGGVPDSSYVLIDDMETTNHGPIQLAMGIAAPLTPGYWYNSGEPINGFLLE